MSEKHVILLDPHLTQSKLFSLLNEVYRVQVYGGISDLPEPEKSRDTWIVSKWQLVDGEAVDIPVSFRNRLIVIDESASLEAWQKCKKAKIEYVSEVKILLEKLRDRLHQEKDNIENEKKPVELNIDTNKVVQQNEKTKARKIKEPTSDPFALKEQMDEVQEESSNTLKQTPVGRIIGKEIIAITQKKGGTGKTTVTETAARIIAERGQKVLVIELDPDGGHLASRLDLFSKGSINLLNHGYSMESIIESRAVRAVVIDYILSPDFSKREVIPPNVVRSLIEQAQQDYDVIMIDCGTAWDETIQAAIQMSTQIWMVSTPDYAALLDGRVLYTKMIQSEIEPERIYHIVNKAKKSKGISLQEVQANVPVSHIFLLPEDKKVEHLQRQKKEPIDCPFGKKLREMVNEVVPFQLDEEEDEEKSSWLMRLPIVGRLFG